MLVAAAMAVAAAAAAPEVALGAAAPAAEIEEMMVVILAESKRPRMQECKREILQRRTDGGPLAICTSTNSGAH